MARIVRDFSIILIICLVILAGFWLYENFLMTKPVQSASTDNVSGWAWSETIGWISFNCTDASCATSNYGVNVNSSTGDFSGYAWSENIGWISFNRADAGNPPAAPYNGGSGPIANFSLVTQKVRGWARALANGDGWDGWIKLGDDSGTWSDQVYVQILAGPDELHGWAWGGDVIGWIGFNCAEGPGLCSEEGGVICAENEICPGTIIPAEGTGICCDVACQLMTCAQQGGDICQANETCPGTIIPARDSNSCCNQTCQLIPEEPKEPEPPPPLPI